MENSKKSLGAQINDLDQEFAQFMDSLKFIKAVGSERLGTYSPLDEVSAFEKKGLGRVEELSRSEMMAQDDPFNKLLATMLGHCQPGALSEDDLNQMTNINGREMRNDLSE